MPPRKFCYTDSPHVYFLVRKNVFTKLGKKICSEDDAIFFCKITLLLFIATEGFETSLVIQLGSL